MGFNYENDPFAEAAREYHKQVVVDMIERAKRGKATEEEVRFLKLLYHELWGLIPKLNSDN